MLRVIKCRLARSTGLSVLETSEHSPMPIESTATSLLANASAALLQERALREHSHLHSMRFEINDSFGW